jgi:hypothetical protein
MEGGDMRSMARTAHLVVAGLLVAGLLTQVFLAGLGVFKDPATFETHRSFGYMLELLPLILLVLALVGRMGRKPALLAAGIFGLFLLQSVFVELRTSVPELAALHPVNGFLITLVAIVLARGAWSSRDRATIRTPGTL